MLSITPGLWSSVRLCAWAERDGYHFSIIGNETVEWIGASGRLRVLVARRFEMMEAVIGQPWRTFTLDVTRTGAKEWRYDVGYGYLPEPDDVVKAR